LLVDVGVVGGVEMPPAAGPRLHPRVALPVDRVADDGLVVGVQITRHVARRNSHAAHQDQRQMREVLADALAFTQRVQPG